MVYVRTLLWAGGEATFVITYTNGGTPSPHVRGYFPTYRGGLYIRVRGGGKGLVPPPNGVILPLGERDFW